MSYERRAASRVAMLAWIGLSFFVNGAIAQIPDPGTHAFESDFPGTANEVYNDDSLRSLVESWVAFRNPLGDHGGTPGFTTVGSGLLVYQGGQGNFSDDLVIRSPVAGVPSSFLMQVRFRRDSAHSNDRADFDVQVGGAIYHVDNGPQRLTGRPGGAWVTNPIDTDTWYILEVIDSNLAPPEGVQFSAANFTGPQITVDWIFIDPVGARVAERGATGFEMRIWEDGNPRPASPLVASTSTNAGPQLGGFSTEPSVIPAMGAWQLALLSLLIAATAAFLVWRQMG